MEVFLDEGTFHECQKSCKLKILQFPVTRFGEPGAHKVAYGVSAPFGPAPNAHIGQFRFFGWGGVGFGGVGSPDFQNKIDPRQATGKQSAQ